jgi:Arc/MetJ-type ribon-helix-helix transcriptional regulator
MCRAVLCIDFEPKPFCTPFDSIGARQARYAGAEPVALGRRRPHRRTEKKQPYNFIKMGRKPLAKPNILPYTIHMDGKKRMAMAVRIEELRPRPPESEKITINLGYVDLGQIDLMVQDGFYSNRTDFIRTAIRNQLDRHADVVRQSAGRKALELGLRRYSRNDLEAALASGELLHINVLGLVSIAADVTAELARASIASVTVLGALQASAEVRAALADRTH